MKKKWSHRLLCRRNMLAHLIDVYKNDIRDFGPDDYLQKMKAQQLTPYTRAMLKYDLHALHMQALDKCIDAQRAADVISQIRAKLP